MAKIEKLKKGTATIYPATIPQAVVDPTNNEKLPVTLAKKAEHGYAAEETPKTLKEIDGSISQLAGEVSLLDAVQGAKIKDIENVLSTANLGQSTQVSVSGVSPLSLPKNAANGGMSVKLEGLTAENLVVNGDFRNGTTGILSLHSTISASGGTLSVTGTGANVNGRFGASITPQITGNKLYFKSRLRVTNSVCTSISALVRSNLWGPIASNSLSVNTPTANEWYNHTGIFTVNENYATSVIEIGHQYADEATASGKVMEVQNFMTINLTATFGAGNEPDLATCDAMFADYFEGVKSFEPTGRVRSVDASGETPTHLYLTSPELRSNGTVKDEIRKGANGYELVRRVGVGTLGANGITGGNFEGGLIGGKTDADGGVSTWSINTVNPISGTQDGRIIVTNVSTNFARPYLSFTVTGRAIGQLRRASFIYKVNSGVFHVTSMYNGDSVVNVGKTLFGSGRFEVYYVSPSEKSTLAFYLNGRNLFDVQIDELKDEPITTLSGNGVGGDGIVFTDRVHYLLASPVITPISHAGPLNSNSNGTVYFEPVIADAGVYDTNLPILLTDYPIASIEEIIKHENGVDTYLNVASAVVAGDGLSFTHPDLTDGDLVLFTYAFDKESTNGNITATFYDSNVVKIDTVTGKAYKITDVVTNGVLTRTLTEV